MNEYNKITALYSRLSVGDEDRDGGESNSIVNQKAFLERYAQQQRLTNIRHYIDDDESGRFFDRSAYSRMMEDVENGKIGVCIMKDLTRWGRDYLQVGNAMEVFRRNNVRFIAVNNGIDSDNPDTLEFAPFINIMSEWYAKDISKKVKTGIRTKGASGKPIATEAPYGYMKDPNNKDFWIIDEEAAEVVRLIFRLFIGGKNRNQIAVYLKNEQILTPTFYLKQHDRGTAKSRPLNEENRYKWNKATLTKILTRQEYCGDVVNFKTTKHFRDKRNHYVDKSEWQITENVHVTVIVTGYEDDEIWGYTANLFLLNKTDKTVMFSVDDASVNGFMADPFYATSVSAGKCAFSSMAWSDTTLEENGITEVEEIEVLFRAYDADDFMGEDFANEVITLNP